MAFKHPPANTLTLTPFLYPSVFRSSTSSAISRVRRLPQTRFVSTINDLPESRLNPSPDDYSSPSFADSAEITLYAGRGGSGCISFLREAYLPEGPPNGGDGGAGGSVYIQAAHGETSLHKIARRRFVRAGRGKNGQGSAKGGTRGEDIVVTVPVGTIVREIEREDPAAEEALNMRAWRAAQKLRKKEERLAAEERERTKAKLARDEGYDEDELEEVLAAREEQEKWEQRRQRDQEDEDEEDDPESNDPERAKWLLYPGLSKTEVKNTSFPRLPRRTRYLHQPSAPVYLDLSKPTPQPILLAAGGIGGLGNPHFTSREHPRPLFATKGDAAVTMRVALELKLLADVGLVGLPNAGKSTLLRALTNSRTRVGSWAFTTLQPNIGTVVLDKYSGRPSVKMARAAPPQAPGAWGSGVSGEEIAEPRTRFTVADIPGLIEGAHLDRGLGIAFLRHVERAGVLAFVLDLSAGNAVEALNALWREVALYAQMRAEEESDRAAASRIKWDNDEGDDDTPAWPSHTDGPIDVVNTQFSSSAPGQHIASKPWYVVATKADLPGTQDNFRELERYLESIRQGEAPHPAVVAAGDDVEGSGWTKNVAVIPVSAINGQGVDRIVHWTAGLLNQ